MSIESELKIRAHCESLRRKVDIAREKAIENIRKASNKLITEIDTYQCECLSSWRPVKESTKNEVEELSIRMRAFIAGQQAFLQRVHSSQDDDLTLRLDEANKLAQELSERKKELKSAMFNDKLASFHAFPVFDDASFGELVFATTKLPFKTLDITNTDLTPIDIRVNSDFVFLLEHGQRIVTVKSQYLNDVTQMCCFDPLGRLIGSENLNCGQLRQENVAQCGPNQFVVCHCVSFKFRVSDSFRLSLYNSSLEHLRSADCKNFTNICCNSKYVFGLWDTYDSFKPDSDDDDDDEKQEEEEYSAHRIKVHRLDTLGKEFSLRVQAKYSIERIMADEHHLVALSRLANMSSCDWYFSIFAGCGRILSGREARLRTLFIHFFGVFV